MRIEYLSSLDQVDAKQWNSLLSDNNPFIKHEFLAALEHHGCVGSEFGWLPHHIVMYDEDKLIAAMPLYEKYNSYGEFVFDHAWANAYEQHGMVYFPKLVSSIPYTPASGERLLCLPADRQRVYPLLLNATLRLAEELQASSFHCLFPNLDQHQFIERSGFITRHDCQFHWKNFNYTTFDDFLLTLSSKKRKNIRQERRKVEQAGVTLRVLNGHTATAADWQRFAFFYNHTFEKKWGTPTMNEGFFAEVARLLPDQVVLVMADKGEACIAGSLMFASDSKLFGRHWGCTEYFDSLHFEACYYQGIEYCIEHGLQVFEPGAQGEHKVARGFIPTRTQSSHWVASSRFRGAIMKHAEHEREGVAHYMDSVREHMPYREDFVEANKDKF